MSKTVQVGYANDEAYMRSIIQFAFTQKQDAVSDGVGDALGAIAAKALIDDIEERGLELAWKPIMVCTVEDCGNVYTVPENGGTATGWSSDGTNTLCPVHSPRWHRFDVSNHKTWPTSDKKPIDDKWVYFVLINGEVEQLRWVGYLIGAWNQVTAYWPLDVPPQSAMAKSRLPVGVDSLATLVRVRVATKTSLSQRVTTLDYPPRSYPENPSDGSSTDNAKYCDCGTKGALRMRMQS